MVSNVIPLQFLKCLQAEQSDLVPFFFFPWVSHGQPLSKAGTWPLTAPQASQQLLLVRVFHLNVCPLCLYMCVTYRDKIQDQTGSKEHIHLYTIPSFIKQCRQSLRKIENRLWKKDKMVETDFYQDFPSEMRLFASDPTDLTPAAQVFRRGLKGV